MSRRYLFGPVSAEFARDYLGPQRERGECLAFNPKGDVDISLSEEDTWESLCAKLPEGWRPDFIALYIYYTAIPNWLWSAPVPLVALAGDWNLQFHFLRQLPGCDLTFTDTRGVHLLGDEREVLAADLYGLPKSFLEYQWPADSTRDIDILFVGFLNLAIHRPRLPYLARLARLAERHRVVIERNVFGDEYRALLARSKIVFNRTLGRVSNRRVWEAATAGALLFVEDDNIEVPHFLADGQECVFFSDANLEERLEYYLTHEDERRRIAEAGRAKAAEHAFGAEWDGVVGLVEERWPALVDRAAKRISYKSPGGRPSLLARMWQRLSTSEPGDPTLPDELKATLAGADQDADWHNALGLLAALAGQSAGSISSAALARATGHFRQAVAADPWHVLARLNLAEALFVAHDRRGAEQAAGAVLELLDEDLVGPLWDAGHFPPAYDVFRVEWERAAWSHVHDVRAEIAAKKDLVRWRAQTLLAEITGRLEHYYEAALARPDLPLAQAALGCALAREHRFAPGRVHLECGVAGNPFDLSAARALDELHRAAGDHARRLRFAAERRLLHQAAPKLVPGEEWFTAPHKEPRPAAHPLASATKKTQAITDNLSDHIVTHVYDGTGQLISESPRAGKPLTYSYNGSDRKVALVMMVKNEEANLPACLQSVLGLFAEIIIVDTGSTDRTRAIALEFGAKVVEFTWVDSFAAARTEGLRHAHAEWVMWLDADERLDPDNRVKLERLFANLPEGNIAFAMRQKSPLADAAHAAVYVDQVRLFRKLPGLAWQYRVHEQILPSLRSLGADVAATEIVIDHLGFADAPIQGAKVDRNGRLLEMELTERPDDPFVLYNLGAVYLGQGKAEQGLELLRRSLEKCRPNDVLVAKLYAMLVRVAQQRGDKEEARRCCREGRAARPQVAELLFWEAILRREDGDLDGAVASLQQLLNLPRGTGVCFTSVDAGLRGYRTRQLLAEVYHQQGRLAEAEAEWTQAVSECPALTPAWLALGRLWADQGRWIDVDRAADHLERDAGTWAEGLVLRGRSLLGRGALRQAQALAERALVKFPDSIPLRVLLSHALLRQGTDLDAAERALKAVLELDPGHAESRQNLEILLRQKEEPQEAQPAPDVMIADGARAEVALFMMVKNEEDNLPTCLDSARGLFGQIVIVDTGSTDRTREIAREYGALVVDFPWVDSFAAARNEGLRHVTASWALWLDADDRLDDVNRDKLRTLFAQLGDARAAYVMKCLCLPDPISRTATVVDHVRLFRNLPGLQWRFRVHEQILPALKEAGCEIRWSDVVIHHTGYQDPALRGRKLQRDLRLLQLELAEQPDNPFTLFNLGAILRELGQPAEAIQFLRKSLDLSQPADSIVRKAYALLAQAQRQAGRLDEALATVREGRRHYPTDLELLFQQGIVLKAQGDKAGAVASWEAVLTTDPGTHFSSVDVGLAGYLTRQNLAVTYEELGRPADAERHWRAALAERSDYEPALVGVAEYALRQKNWTEVEEMAARLETLPAPVNAGVVRARLHLARQEFEAALALLRPLIAEHPQAQWPRVILSHVLLQQGQDWAAAEQALRDILALAPQHEEARKNLKLLLTQQGKAVDPELTDESTLAKLFRSACATPTEGNEHLPELYALARQCRHITTLGAGQSGVITALLYAKPAKLLCYDAEPSAQVERLRALANGTQFVLQRVNGAAPELEETDLLVIDAGHASEQLPADLNRHGERARRYIVLQGTASLNGATGDSVPIVEAFVAKGSFQQKDSPHQHSGLTILERR